MLLLLLLLLYNNNKLQQELQFAIIPNRIPNRPKQKQNPVKFPAREGRERRREREKGFIYSVSSSWEPERIHARFETAIPSSTMQCWCCCCGCCCCCVGVGCACLGADNVNGAMYVWMMVVGVRGSVFVVGQDNSKRMGREGLGSSLPTLWSLHDRAEPGRFTAADYLLASLQLNLL